MTFILAIFSSKLARQIGAVMVAILAIITFGQIQKRKGAADEHDKQERADNENANNIRDRVDAVDSVSDDDIKYRD